MASLNDNFEVALGASKFEKRHSAPTWIASPLTAVLGNLAHLLNLSISDTLLHDKHPILLDTFLARRLPHIGRMVIQHRHSCDNFHVPLLPTALGNASPRCAAEEHNQGAQVARKCQHCKNARRGFKIKRDPGLKL